MCHTDIITTTNLAMLTINNYLYCIPPCKLKLEENDGKWENVGKINTQ